MGIRILQSDREIIKRINEAAIRKIIKDFYLKNNISIIEDVVRSFVRNAIEESATWQSLKQKGGGLNLGAEFGIPLDETESRLQRIIDLWANEIKVTPQNLKRRPSSFIFSYRFYAIKANWASVLNSDDGITNNKSQAHPEGQRLPWLEWLLVMGDQLEIGGYKIDYGNHPKSRSKQAIMIKASAIWKVPKQFGAFSSEDNFVTRALENLVKNNEFKNELEARFKNIADFEYNNLTREFDF